MIWFRTKQFCYCLNRELENLYNRWGQGLNRPVAARKQNNSNCIRRDQISLNKEGPRNAWRAAWIRPDIRSNILLRCDIQTQMFNSLRNKASWVIDELCSTDRNTITVCVHNVLPPAKHLLNCTPHCCNGRMYEGTEIIRITDRGLYVCVEVEYRPTSYMLIHKQNTNASF